MYHIINSVIAENDLLDPVAPHESQNLEFRDTRVRQANLSGTPTVFAAINAGKAIIGMDEKTRQITG